MPKNQKMMTAKSKMKGSTLSWWNFSQNERVEEGMNPISSWKRMVAEVKNKFVHEDYEMTMHKKLHGLR